MSDERDGADGDDSAGEGVTSDIGAGRPAERIIDAEGLLLLPGIVDIHSDAFERQIMPRPGVDVSYHYVCTQPRDCCLAWEATLRRLASG